VLRVKAWDASSLIALGQNAPKGPSPLAGAVFCGAAFGVMAQHRTPLGHHFASFVLIGRGV